MSPLRLVLDLARADFLERARRYSFLVTLGVAVYLGYVAGTGKMILRTDDYRGIYNSAWIGAMMASVAAVFLSLAGFYVVKNTVDRDRETGVGEILATTPVTKVLYAAGKVLSNFLVLALMVGILAGGALAMNFLRAEEGGVDTVRLLSPFLTLALPAMLVVAAFAFLFETVSWLRGGFGNFAWFFVWNASLALTFLKEIHDFAGVQPLYRSIAAAARAAYPAYRGGFSFSVGGGRETGVETFRWEGIEWTPEFLFGRLAWVAIAVALTLLGAFLFDRFDPSRSRPRAARGGDVAPEEPPVPEPPPRAGAPTPHPILPPPAPAFRLPGLVVAELRLSLRGLRWWWYAGFLGLLVASLASPISAVRGAILPIAWIWPLLVWSPLGCREARSRTEPLLFSTPHPMGRFVPATWLAGVLLAALAGSGALLRFALAGDAAALLAWAAGALFIPSLALALGAWSGSPKPFEALYTALWYAGPMNRTPGLDFTGSTVGTPAAGSPVGWYLASAVLLALGALGYGRRLRN